MKETEETTRRVRTRPERALDAIQGLTMAEHATLAEQLVAADRDLAERLRGKLDLALGDGK